MFSRQRKIARETRRTTLEIEAYTKVLMTTLERSDPCGCETYYCQMTRQWLTYHDPGCPLGNVKPKAIKPKVNCINCGAANTGPICAYCGTHH